MHPEVTKKAGVADLPLVFARRFVEDVFLTINGKNSVLHDALPRSG